MNVKNPNTMPFREMEDFMNRNGFTQSSIARLLGVSAVTISKWKDSGEIPAKRAGAIRLIISCTGSGSTSVVNTGHHNNFFTPARDAVIKKILADESMCAECKNKAIAYIMNNE